MIRQQRGGVRKDGPKRATERSDRAKREVSGQRRRTELGDIVGPTDRRHGQANHDDTDAISHLTQKANETWNDRATERGASENPEQVSSDIGMTTVTAEGPMPSTEDNRRLTNISDRRRNTEIGTSARRRRKCRDPTCESRSP
jgi:hypothetical protein